MAASFTHEPPRYIVKKKPTRVAQELARRADACSAAKIKQPIILRRRFESGSHLEYEACVGIEEIQTDMKSAIRYLRLLYCRSTRKVTDRRTDVAHMIRA